MPRKRGYFKETLGTEYECSDYDELDVPWTKSDDFSLLVGKPEHTFCNSANVKNPTDDMEHHYMKACQDQ
jgi:hypothetical protein